MRGFLLFGGYMPAGFQSFDASGNPMTEITDRLTRVVAEGKFNLAPGTKTWVPISGMVDDGTWFVVVSEANSAIPGAGGFNAISSQETDGPYLYTVFRI